MYLFFDIETTNKANLKAPFHHPTQPHIVQLGALLTDEKGNELSSLDVLIQPDGWTITLETEAIHHISHEQCVKYGIPIKSALSVFNMLLANAEGYVAHSLDFDQLLINAEFHRIGKTPRFEGKTGICTKLKMMNVCKLPNQYYPNEFKWPSLAEAYNFFFPGKQIEGAHNALVDCRACKEIYLAYKQHINP